MSEDGKEDQPTKGDSLENELEEELFEAEAATPRRGRGSKPRTPAKKALQIELDIEEET